MRMKAGLALLSALALATPAFGQATSSAALPAAPGFSGMFTPWTGISRDALRIETERRAEPGPESGAVPAGMPVRSRAEAAALGERVAEVVRAGDCAEGERMAREAGDFPLVRAVRDYCRSNPG